MERDPRVVLSFAAPRDTGVVLNPYAVIRAHVTVQTEETAAGERLDRLAGVYVEPGRAFRRHTLRASSSGTGLCTRAASARGRRRDRDRGGGFVI